VTGPEWTEEKVLADINEYRQKLGLGVITAQEKLNRAAKARLAVILEDDDLLGEITGLTREKALDVVGYEYSWVGDLAVLDLFNVNDPVAYWAQSDVQRQTMEETNMKEAGIAIKQTNESVSIYVLLSAPKKMTKIEKSAIAKTVTWGGRELWNAINNKRVEFGVGQLSQKDELCTIAAIRLNQILDLGKLDAHAGFESTLNREDLRWISDKYDISEFLVSGYDTPEEAVRAWENTLGHRKLLTGGEYVWGCVYAQNRYGVAIAAF